MTILQMLEQQCDFIKVPVFDDRPPEIAELRKMDVSDEFWDFYFFNKRPEMAELRRLNLPGDFWDFYWETDGGTGRVFYPAYRKPCTFILYGNEKMQEMKKWFLEYSTMLYEELWLLDERKVNAEEQELLRSVSADLVILGECGDPKWPDYLFVYKDAFFLKPRDSLDFPFLDDWSVEEEECASRGSYYDFLSKVLKSMEPAEMKEEKQ